MFYKPKEVHPEATASRETRVPLPWGARDPEYYQDDGHICFDFDLGSKVRKSDLSINISSRRLEVAVQDKDTWRVVLDETLTNPVKVSESMWTVEDERVLNFSLCQDQNTRWHSLFQRDQSPDAAILHSSRSRERSNKIQSQHPTLFAKPSEVGEKVHAAPSPLGLGSVANDVARSVQVPERFLLEKQTGTRLFQINLAKPLGWRVEKISCSRSSPGVCEICFTCERQLANGSNERLAFYQQAQMGTDLFQAEAAEFTSDTSENMLTVRIPYRQSLCGAVHLDPGGAGDDCDLEGDEYVSRCCHLRCRSCREAFTSADQIMIARALPSGRFDECIEDMICYDGPTAVPMLARDVSFARFGFCLIGDSTLLVHPRDVARNAITISKIATVNDLRGGKVGWRSFACARCGVRVGHAAPTHCRTSEGGQETGMFGATDPPGPGQIGDLLFLKHTVVASQPYTESLTCEASSSDVCGDEVSGQIEEIDGDDLGRTNVLAEAACAGKPVEPPRELFADFSAVHWLMREMEHAHDVDRCTRFTLVNDKDDVWAKRLCLRLVLYASTIRISEDCRFRPRHALRVSFLEQELDESEAETDTDMHSTTRADEHSRREVHSRDQTQRGKTDRTPPRFMDLSHDEYVSIRRRLVQSSWASFAGRSCCTTRNSPVEGRLSYLF